MSRIGKQAIELPQGVRCEIANKEVRVTGEKGTLIVQLPPHVECIQQENALHIRVPKSVDSRQAAFWGLGRSLVANAVEGVTKGFEKKLEIHGVGYKAAMKGAQLELQVGYSHPVLITPMEGIVIATEGNTITVSGADKQRVGETAAQIRKVRPPEPYKGKGIKYADEVVRRKQGKVMKSAE